MPLSTQDLDYLKVLIAGQSGNVVSNRQTYLLERSLHSVVSKRGMTDVSGLVEHHRRTKDMVLTKEIAEAVTINETSFFRDSHPYEALRRSILPQLIESNKATRTLKVWCAACSSGQEPYSIAMTIREFFPQLDDWNVSIHATDISEEMLDKSRRGTFSQLEVNRGLPARRLIRFFDRQGTDWIAKEDIRSLVQCRSLNLSRPWPFLGEFDLIFIRNVLIYFDQESKQDILSRASRLLKPDGFLFLGSSESTIGINVPLERKQIDDTVCYQRGN